MVSEGVVNRRRQVANLPYSRPSSELALALALWRLPAAFARHPLRSPSRRRQTNSCRRSARQIVGPEAGPEPRRGSRCNAPAVRERSAPPQAACRYFPHHRAPARIGLLAPSFPPSFPLQLPLAPAAFGDPALPPMPPAD